MISTQSDTIIIDTLSIVPGSLIFLADKKYDVIIDYPKASIIWQSNLRDKNDSVEVIYKVYPLNFDKAFTRENEMTSVPLIQRIRIRFTRRHLPVIKKMCLD